MHKWFILLWTMSSATGVGVLALFVLNLDLAQKEARQRAEIGRLKDSVEALQGEFSSTRRRLDELIGQNRALAAERDRTRRWADTEVRALNRIIRTLAPPVPPAVLAALRGATAFELYSLDPAADDNNPDGFHGWKVLGRTAVTDPVARAALVEAVIRGEKESSGVEGSCFLPRHGVRVAGRGRTVDLVLCFECGHVETYGPGEEKGYFSTTKTPLAVFNRTLADARVPLPNQAGE